MAEDRLNEQKRKMSIIEHEKTEAMVQKKEELEGVKEEALGEVKEMEKREKAKENVTNAEIMEKEVVLEEKKKEVALEEKEKEVAVKEKEVSVEEKEKEVAVEEKKEVAVEEKEKEGMEEVKVETADEQARRERRERREKLRAEAKIERRRRRRLRSRRRRILARLQAEGKPMSDTAAEIITVPAEYPMMVRKEYPVTEVKDYPLYPVPKPVRMDKMKAVKAPKTTGVLFIPCFPSEEGEEMNLRVLGGEERILKVLTPLHYMYPYPGTEKDEVAKGDLTLNYQVQVNTAFQTEVKIINFEPERKRSLRVKLISSLGGLKALSPEVPISVKEDLAAREQRSLVFSFQVKKKVLSF